MWQLMLCLLTANIVPAMITALIQNIQELTCLWPSYVGRKELSLPPVWVKRKGHFCPEWVHTHINGVVERPNNSSL